MSSHRIRLVLTFLTPLVASACSITGKPPEPMPEPTGLFVQLAEVRIQWAGTFGEFFPGQGGEGFPGLHIPQDIVRLAELMATFEYSLDPQTPLTTLGRQIRDRFNAYAGAAGAEYVLWDPLPTQTGPIWRRGADGLAFPVRQDGDHERFYETQYGSESGSNGRAWYWILYRVIGMRE